MSVDFVKKIAELNKSNVFIKHPDRVNSIINEMVQGGISRLQIVSDFDQTITKQHEDGKKYMSSFAMFHCCPSVPQNYIETTQALRAKYYAIEIDPLLPLDEKKKYIEEWYGLSEEAIKGLKVSQLEIERICNEINASLRDGTKELFDQLYKNDIPVLVFSAGLGDVVKAVLKHCNVLLANVKVISNFMKYNEDGTIIGFENALIHVFNKNEHAIQGTHFYEEVSDRDNVILMGDHIGDANMCEGIEHLNSVLKIGFLYEHSEEALPNYMDHFDIVLNDDQTMDVIRAILSHII